MSGSDIFDPTLPAPISLGAAELRQVIDIDSMPFGAADIFPDASDEDVRRVAERWGAQHVDVAARDLLLSFYSTVLRIGGKTVVIDTCCGNDKARPERPGWHQRQGPYLDRLAAAGVRPEDVDFVMCTHLHADHVGWNTRLENGEWVPTFPNASYIFARLEYDYWQAAYEQAGERLLYGSYADSVLPVIRSGQAQLVDDGASPLGGVHLEVAPGHTPGAALIHVESESKQAVMCGDLLHHPIQLLRPQLSTRFCVDPDRARATRQALLRRVAGTSTLVVPGHFVPPSIGRIEADGAEYRFLPA